MEPAPTWILKGAGWSLLVSAVTVRSGPAAGAPIAAAALLLALWRGAGPSLLALPVFLAALSPGPDPAEDPGTGPILLRGTLVDPRPSSRDDGVLFTVVRNGRALRAHALGSPRLLPGDEISAFARSSPPSVPGEAPRVVIPEGALRIERSSRSLGALAAACRLDLAASLRARLGGDEGALLQSLVLGRGPRAPEALQKAHRATGLSHLLAVSGAHASMVAMLLGLLPFTGRPRPPRKGWRAGTGLALLFLYGGIAGMEPPVFRALVAFGLLAWAQMRRRRLPLSSALGVPAILTCILWPRGALGASFQLSYAAVYGLSLARRARGRFAAARTALSASLWATICTAPFSLIWFGQLAPWTILLTPLLAPLVAFLLLDGLLVAVAGTVSAPIADALALPLGPALRAYCGAVLWADELPLTPIFAPFVPPAPLVAIACGFSALTCRRLGRRAGSLCASLAVSATCLVPRAPASARLTLFAVGHGQACLLVTATGEQVAIDCGSLDHDRLPARAIEQSLVRRRIDLLILTHGDRDHAGAASELSQRVPIARVIGPQSLADSPFLAALRGAGIETIRPGQRRRPLPGIEVSCPDAPGGTPNDTSLWVRAALGADAVLLCGDAEERGVEAALADGTASAASVLVLPHHGRPNRRIGDLLDAVRPKVCLCSAEPGRPLQAEPASARAIPVHSTGNGGDITLRPGPWVERTPRRR
ncbi:MAG: hypothetical protein Fur0037_18210 [Planctomycetota bacterium]